MIGGNKSSEESSENLGVISPDLSFDNDDQLNKKVENPELEDKLLAKINAMKKTRVKDSASENGSQNFNYDSEKLNASISSDELDEIMNKVESDAKHVDEVDQDRIDLSEPEVNKVLKSSPNDSSKSSEKAKNIDLTSPEVLKIIKSIPEDLEYLPNEYSEFIQDEDIKIKDLLEDNKITIKEYNKIMKYKYKSQLNLTGLSNVSEINASIANILCEPNIEQSVLFGKNFVNQHEPTQSDVSLFKIQTNDEDENESIEAQKKRDINAINNFSMSKQIEEFKKMLESSKNDNEEESKQYSNEKLEEKKNSEDFIKDLNLFSKSKHKEDYSNENKNNNNITTKFEEGNIKLTSSIEENPNLDNFRDTEINTQWDDMIRQATNAPIRK